MRPGQLNRRLIAAALFFIFSTPVAFADALTNQAKQLLDKHQAQAAYDLLEPLQSERAGEPEYDYLLGIAALDSGKPGVAVFALERVLAVQPDHAQARAEIARAYFELGEVSTAQAEFQAVKKQNPPTEVSATIDKFLSAIDRVNAAAGRSVQGYVEYTFGRDTNVNSATSGSQIAIPALGGLVFTLNAAGVKAPDTFMSVSSGINFRSPLSHELSLLGGLNFNQRWNNHQDTFDTGSLGGNIGLSLLQGPDEYSISLQTQAFDVDNSLFRKASGAVGQWQHSLNANNQVSGYLQYTRLTYPGQETSNVDRYVLGGAGVHVFGGDYHPLVYSGLYLGEERTRADNVPQLGHKLIGFNVGGQLEFSSSIKLFSSLGIEQRRYGGTDPLFLVGRRDLQTDFRLGLNYFVMKNWTITPQLAYTRNDSNVAINDFDRAQAYVSVRYDFK